MKAGQADALEVDIRVDEPDSSRLAVPATDRTLTGGSLPSASQKGPYDDAIELLVESSWQKTHSQWRWPVAHLVRSAAAGAYIGVAITLICVVGAGVYELSPSMAKPVMGVCFGGALTIVYFAGSELFTGGNLVATLGVLKRRIGLNDLLANWVMTWVGNWVGAAALAGMVVASGVLRADPVQSFVIKIAEAKVSLPWAQMFWRGVLANWMVCLGVWMMARMKSESGKLVMVWWCMFTFIACSFEHSVANMSGILLGLLESDVALHPKLTWTSYGYNLAVVTLGNIVGGAALVAGVYWLASPTLRGGVADIQRQVVAHKS